jgi:hypothetical protein
LAHGWAFQRSAKIASDFISNSSLKFLGRSMLSVKSGVPHIFSIFAQRGRALISEQSETLNPAWKFH